MCVSCSSSFSHYLTKHFLLRHCSKITFPLHNFSKIQAKAVPVEGKGIQHFKHEILQEGAIKPVPSSESLYVAFLPCFLHISFLITTGFEVTFSL